MTNFSRRDFLKIGAAGAATAILTGCSQESERWVELEPYVRAPEEQIAGKPSFYASTCRMCPAACGIVVRVMNGRAILIEGNPEHPVSQGKVCARGQAGLQLLYHPDRVTAAVEQRERGSREFRAIAWNEAINTLHSRISAAEGGVGVWLGGTTSGHLADLFKRFTTAIGAPDPVRYDLYSALHGYGPLMAANAALFDQPALPTYDLAHADAVFSFGADFLGTWLNATGFGVAFGYFREQAYGQRGYLVQFEPRMSITGAKADRWLPLKPGTEGLVAAALVRIIADEGFGSPERVERAQALAAQVDVEDVAVASGIAAEDLVIQARAFAEADHPVALPGSAMAGLDNAVDAVSAVQALNLVAGTVGELGGMSITPALPVEGPGSVPVSSYGEVQAMIERLAAGDIKVLLIHGANPLYDLPEDSGIREAFDRIPTIVSFNSIADETALYADFVLPDRVYLEGWGYDVAQPGFGGLPIISGQQPVVGPFYDLRATGDVLLTVAKGIPEAADALPWTDEVAYIRWVVDQLPKGAAGGDDAEVRWARFQQYGGWWPETASSDAPQSVAAGSVAVSAATFEGDAEEFPYHLQLVMSPVMGDGLGASTPWQQGVPEPLTTITWGSWVEINPETASEHGINTGDLIRVTSPHGELELPAYVFPAIRPDTIAIPVGQGHTDMGRYARDRGENPVHLLGAATDASGQHLAWAALRVKLERTGGKKDLARLESKVDPGEEAHIPF